MRPQYTSAAPLVTQLSLPGLLDGFKQCRKCAVLLPATTEFFFTTRGYLYGTCKKCISVQQRSYYSANKNAISQQHRLYNEKNKDSLIEYRRQYYQSNKDRISNQTKEYRTANRDTILQRGAKYRQNNRDSLRERDKQWRESEAGRAARAAYKSRPDVVAKRRERHREYYPQWLSAVPGRRAAHTMGVLMGRALRGQKAGCRWESVVGYTLTELMQHLEARFKPGMTWENYGRKGWHIDHIIPRSAFSFESADDPQFRECWALSNLQPLWEPENLSKKNKVLADGV